MRSFHVLTTAALLIATAAGAEPLSEQPLPVVRTVGASMALRQEAMDLRAAHLARAALEGQQVDTLSREELVSLFLLMSLHQSKRQPS